MKYVFLFILMFLIGYSTDAKAKPPEGNSRPTAETGKTVPKTEVAEVVNRLISLTGTEAKMETTAKNAVKEFNGKHVGDRVVFMFEIRDIKTDGPVYH